VSSGLKPGADSFIVKPHSLDETVRMEGTLRAYYFGIVRLPEKNIGTSFPCRKNRARWDLSVSQPNEQMAISI